MPDSVQQTIVSAPGKIILMGEHAAVYGHPAVVAAIDLRLKVTLSPVAGMDVWVDLPELNFCGSTPWEQVRAYTNHCRNEWLRRFRSSQPQLQEFMPHDGPPDRLVQLALGETIDQVPDAQPMGVRVRVDSELPVRSGFGSSAALAVGVAAAYLRFLGLDDDTELLRNISLEVERRQHGTPSGVDNNAVLEGGLLLAERDAHGNLVLESIALKSPLLARFRVFHSGMPAEPTGVLVEAVRKRISKARRRFRSVLARIDQATQELCSILRGEHEEPSRLIALIKQCEACLEELGVVPEPIIRIIRKIEEAGGAAKISGAGALTGAGGGSILVYHPDPEKIARWDFLSDWLPLPVRLGSEGLRAEGSA